MTRNEILKALNVPERYILAIVQVADGQAAEPRYVWGPVTKEPESFAESVNYKLEDLLSRSGAPA